MTLDIQFGQGTAISGNGQDAIGYFKLTGTYKYVSRLPSALRPGRGGAGTVRNGACHGRPDA